VALSTIHASKPMFLATSRRRLKFELLGVPTTITKSRCTLRKQNFYLELVVDGLKKMGHARFFLSLKKR
jgi:hypothetical protein